MDSSGFDKLQNKHISRPLICIPDCLLDRIDRFVDSDHNTGIPFQLLYPIKIMFIKQLFIHFQIQITGLSNKLICIRIAISRIGIHAKFHFISNSIPDCADPADIFFNIRTDLHFYAVIPLFPILDRLFHRLINSHDSKMAVDHNLLPQLPTEHLVKRNLPLFRCKIIKSSLQRHLGRCMLRELMIPSISGFPQICRIYSYDFRYKFLLKYILYKFRRFASKFRERSRLAPATDPVFVCKLYDHVTFYLCRTSISRCQYDCFSAQQKHLC